MVAHGEGGSPMTTSDVETDLKLITLRYISLHHYSEMQSHVHYLGEASEDDVKNSNTNSDVHIPECTCMNKKYKL